MKSLNISLKLQSKLIQEKKFIDVKVDEAIAKHYYLEKIKYELLPQVAIHKIPSHVKLTKVDKTPNMTLHTVPSHHLTHHQNQSYIT